MNVQLDMFLDTAQLADLLSQLYVTCAEVHVLEKMLAELKVGSRNANEAWAIQELENRLKDMKRERWSLHKMIREVKERKAQ